MCYSTGKNFYRRPYLMVNVITNDHTQLQDVYTLFLSLSQLLLIAYDGTQGAVSFHVSSGFIRPLCWFLVFTYYWYSFLTSVWTCYYCALTLLSLRLIQDLFKVECFPANCTFILAAYLTHCKRRKWNMCLGGWCDRCDPADCWLSWIVPCFVCHSLRLCPHLISHNTWTCSRFKSFHLFIFQILQKKKALLQNEMHSLNDVSRFVFVDMQWFVANVVIPPFIWRRQVQSCTP